jgi:hypothetical protein
MGILLGIVPASLGVAGENSDDVFVQTASAQFKVYQFEQDQIPRIDGVATDWAKVPESYTVGSDQLKDTLRRTKNDPATLDVSVKVGWVKGLNRIYFLYEAYDDYWDFEMPGMHNDILEVMIDGDASGGPITAIADPAVKHGTWEAYLKQGVQAQNYHIFTPSKGKNWAMAWGCQPWALEFPWSNAAQSYDFKHGESGRYTLEFWITPFDHAPIDGPKTCVVTKLNEGSEIGLSWVVLDYDDENAGKNGYRSFNNLSRKTRVHSDADLLRRFRLMPIESEHLRARWSFAIENLQQRKVAFKDESTGQVSSWHWDFGDGTTSTEQNPVHVYETGGQQYVVTLTIEDGKDKDTFSRIWEVSLP